MSESYIRFFSESWGTIRACLEELYSDRNTYRADILQRITVVYDRILLACGLELSDAESGFSLNVHDVS